MSIKQKMRRGIVWVLTCVALVICSAPLMAQQQASYQFATGDHLTYTVSYSGGSCRTGSYQQTNYSNVVYVDLNGSQISLGGGGSYITSPGGSGCPPSGPEPTNGMTYTGTSGPESYSISFMPGASSPSASVSYPYCSVSSTYYPNTIPNGYGPPNTHWEVDGSSTCPGATLFYTTDGSQPTEASSNCGTGCTIYVGGSPAPVQIVAVQMQASGKIAGVAVQNGQATSSDFKTVLASTQSQSQPYASAYNTHAPDYCSTQYCIDGVQGIPTAINFASDGSLSFPSASPVGGTTAANFNFTTENLQGTFDGVQNDPCYTNPNDPCEQPNGTQVLWPYNAGNGCDSCTSMVQDFYIWPQNNSSVSAASTQNWEMDLQGWDTTDHLWFGASLQCSGADGGWEYNGQSGTWHLLKDANGNTLNHDCTLPYGTLGADIGATDTQFALTPAHGNSTIEPGMIVMVDSEEMFCTAVSGNTCTSALRGWGYTTAAAHSSGAPWSGSVHVQYHVTMDPGNSSNVYIDYLNLNYYPGLGGNSALNHYDFRQIYGTQTLSDGTAVSTLQVTAPTLPSGYPDRVFDQKQIDVAPGIGSTSSPVTVGEFVDQDNVTASYGILGAVTLAGQQ